MKVRVLLADDHKMFRHALRLILEDDPNVEVVGEAGDGQEMLALAHRVEPDVVCMDISMPLMDGIDATRRLLAIRPVGQGHRAVGLFRPVLCDGDDERRGCRLYHQG